MRLPLDFLSFMRGLDVPPTLSSPAITAILRTVWALPRFESQRIVLSQLTELLPLAPDVAIEEMDLGGVRTLRITPPDAGEGAVLYLHGGGFCVLSPEAYSSMLSWLARSAGVTIYAPAYRLGPENPFPAAHDDCVAAAVAVLDHVAPEKLVIGGDSAGGNLALGAAVALVHEQHVSFAGLVLLSPFVNPDVPVDASSDPMLTERWIEKVRAEYMPEDGSDPRITPIYADLHGLPPTLIQTAQGEILHSQALAAELALRAVGVKVTLEDLPDFWHSGHIFSGLLKAAGDQTERVASFVRDCLETDTYLASMPTG